MKPYYPEIKTTHKADRIEFTTYLRIKKGKIWYEQCFREVVYKEPFIKNGEVVGWIKAVDNNTLIYGLNRLHHAVYISQNIGKVLTELKDLYRNSLYPVSDIQISEKRKLLKL